MGIIAVLAGIALVVMGIVQRKAPEFKTKARLQKISAAIELFRSQTSVYPPTDLGQIKLKTGFPVVPGKVGNTTNAGIESLYQCLMLPGFDHHPDMTDDERGNTDEDALDKPLAATVGPELYEFLDAWGNPLVYLVDADYGTVEKTDVSYVRTQFPEGEESAHAVKAWKSSNNQYAQQGKYQLFSMGPDGVPNTADDLKAWDP
jgi:hypothetical protein